MLDTVNTTELDTDNTNTTAVTSYYGTAGDTAGNIKYDPFAPNQVAAQHALNDVQTIKPRTRDEYVGLFKRTEERTARATLQMCRVVYEAQAITEGARVCGFLQHSWLQGYKCNHSQVLRHRQTTTTSGTTRRFHAARVEQDLRAHTNPSETV